MGMPRKRFTPEQIIGKLREAEVELASGATVGQVCKKLEIAEQTYYRWRAEYGGMRVDQAKRAIAVARKLNSEDVLDRLMQLFLARGLPAHTRSDNGPEFVAEKVREWLQRLEVGPLFIEPGSPWDNGYNESFNGKLRDELLKREVFDTLLEAKVLVERWRRHYNQVRPHSSLGYRPPAPEAVLIEGPRLGWSLWGATG
jgi:transposase InsO family protein